MLDFLTEELKNALQHLRFDLLYELRIRLDSPVKIKYDGSYRYLSPYGITNKSDCAIITDEEDIREIVYKGGQHSIYSVENQIKKGFITTRSGERIGLAGEFVYEGGAPLTIRNISSLCIRIPHAVIGCAKEIYQICNLKKGGSAIILSPPGQGKTTILRDLARLLVENQRNVLICDERGEIAIKKPYNGCDVLSYGTKEHSFEVGIRSLCPDYLICDELTDSEIPIIKRAEKSGIFVIASAHFYRFDELPPFFGVFDWYVYLKKEGIGMIENIYDRNYKKVCLT